MKRREFLHLSLATAAGLFLAACSKAIPKLVSGNATLDDVIGTRPQKLTVIGVGTELLSGHEERVAFGLVDSGTSDRVIGASGDLWLALTRTEPALGPFPFAYHGDGLGEKGIYETNVTFPKDGQWLMVTDALVTGSKDRVIGGATVQVGRQTQMPVPGDPAVSVVTPTVADHAGVDPICTRKPPCSMHELSLDKALKNGKPTVFVIATPAFCESQLCGPEVDLVQEMSLEFASRANFIHAEVYKNDDPKTIAAKSPLSPASDAWHLDQEPAIWFIDTTGVVKSRGLGPLDRADVRAYVQNLIG